MQHKGVSERYTIDSFEVSEQIKEIIKIKSKNYSSLIYTYDTTEFKIYSCKNGRKYEVYKNGKIFALPFSYTDSIGRTRNFGKREIIPSVTKNGYYEISIGGRHGERWLVHRLVATTWIENKNNLSTIDHLNNNKGDNSVENLEWVTREENINRQWNDFEGFDLQKCYKNWKISSKITPEDRIKIREIYKNGVSQKDISEIYNMSQSQISTICRDSKSTSENKELFENCWYWERLIEELNALRDKFLETKDIRYWKELIRWLPESWLQTRTVTMSYENVRNMYLQRVKCPHKLTEWKISFGNWVKELPYSDELICINKNN